MNNYRFGKNPAKHDYRTLRLRKYLTSSLAPPPAQFDVLPTIYSKLKISDPARLFPMDGNDQYGDCTIAALAHAETVYNGLLGKMKIWDAMKVVKLYFHLSGGVDSGLDELGVLNYWRKNAVNGDEILAFASIDVKNHQHVQQAISLFGGVYLGFQVQKNCLNEFNAHQAWQPGKLTNDGHAVYATGYNAAGVTVLTWGSTQTATWPWWDECVDEAYAILPSQARDAQFAPGFDLEQLKKDLTDVAH